MDTRAASLASHDLSEAHYENVANWATFEGYTDLERAALEYAEKFAVDHLAIDQDLIDRLRTHLGDEAVFELSLCVASWMSLGRLTQVMGVEASCPLRL